MRRVQQSHLSGLREQEVSEPDIIAQYRAKISEWSERWPDVHVAVTVVGDYVVSTVFFPGSNYSFETALLDADGGFIGVLDRYDTEREAQAGHWRQVYRAISAGEDGPTFPIKYDTPALIFRLLGLVDDITGEGAMIWCDVHRCWTSSCGCEL